MGRPTHGVDVEVATDVKVAGRSDHFAAEGGSGESVTHLRVTRRRRRSEIDLTACVTTERLHFEASMFAVQAVVASGKWTRQDT